MRKLTIAVEGCCHGALDSIYKNLSIKEKTLNKKVDLLLICGDFQAIRNVTDLETMSCPDKYKQIGGFYRYYTGERRAPVPTILIGGNHEANNHMRELYFGGWVAPNIYYLGNSGVVKFGGLRIGGISGIFKDHDFPKGHFERPPFRGAARPAMHHARSYEVFKLLQVKNPLDIFISHDWPQYIERYGDLNGLLRAKPFFKDEVNKGMLGSPANALLLEYLRPKWWFSAHLHVRFEACVNAQDSIFTEGWAGIPPYDKPPPEDMSVPPVAEAITEDGAAAIQQNADEIIFDASDCELGDDTAESSSVTPKRKPELASDAPDGSNPEPLYAQTKRSRISLNLPLPKHTSANENPDFNPESSVAPAQPSEEEQPLEEPRNGNEQTPDRAAEPPKAPALPESPRVPGRATKFLALDKCLPRREFLEFIDVESPEHPRAPLRFEYDPEWLAIVRHAHRYLPLTSDPFYPPSCAPLSQSIPSVPQFAAESIQRDLDWIYSNVFADGRRVIPNNFEQIAPVPPKNTPDSVSFGLATKYGNTRGGRGGRGGYGDRGGRGGGNYNGPRDMQWLGPRPYSVYRNPQTDQFCKMIGIVDGFTQLRFKPNNE